MKKNPEQSSRAGQKGKYLKYAIGEIVLVVIGILIALQVSNWNTNRLASKEEQKTIQSIHAEFIKNQQVLNKSITNTKNSIQTGRYLMNLINTDLEYLKTQNTDSLIFEIFESGDLNVTENSILELLQSGKLGNLKNDRLKSLIFDWTQKKNKAESGKNNVAEKSTFLVNYLMKRYPLKNIDAYGILKWKNSSRLKVNKHQIFNDLEFENIIDDYLYNLVNYNIRVKELQETVISIIKNSKAND